MTPRVITIQMIAIEEVAGNGTEGNPFRTINKWFTLNGAPMLSRDSATETTTVERFLVEALYQAYDRAAGV